MMEIVGLTLEDRMRLAQLRDGWDPRLAAARHPRSRRQAHRGAPRRSHRTTGTPREKLQDGSDRDRDAEMEFNPTRGSASFRELGKPTRRTRLPTRRLAGA